MPEDYRDSLLRPAPAPPDALSTPAAELALALGWQPIYTHPQAAPPFPPAA